MNKHLSIKKHLVTGFLSLAVAFGPLAGISYACTSVLVGKNATADGSVIISRNEDAQTAWTKRYIVHPKTVNKKGATFKSNANKFTYPLPAVSYKYSATPDWDQSEGQFEEAGINELGVAVSATESVNSNDKVQAVDPYVEDTGITEAAIPSVILPSAKTARDGVLLLGKIVETKGSGEGFGVSIADKNEAWYVECGSGHRWVAVRIPDDSYFVTGNQLRIGDVNLNDTKNYLGSKDVKTFAAEKGLYDPNKESFNFAKIYGSNDTAYDLKYNYPRVWWGEHLLTPSAVQEAGKTDYPLFMKPDKKITLSDVMSVLRSHYEGTQYDPYKVADATTVPRPVSVRTTMESHVIQLRSNMPTPIANVQWLALGVPETSIYVPFYEGITQTPTAYRNGTDKYDKNSAYWAFRSIDALTSVNFEDYSKISIPALRNFEKYEFTYQKHIDQSALNLYKQSPQKASEYLTKQANTLSSQALNVANDVQSQLITKLTKLKPSFHDSNL